MTFSLSNHQPRRSRATSSRLALAASALAAFYGAVKASEPTRAIRSAKTKEADDTVKACFAFDKVLEAAVASHPDDDLAIEPTSRLSVDVNEGKLCLVRHDYGTRYRVTVWPGFTCADGNHMRADETAGDRERPDRRGAALMRWRRIAWLLSASALLAATGLGLDRSFPLDLSRARMLSPELRDASGRVLNLLPAADGAIRLAAAPETVGADIVPLLLAREDRRFWQMPGVDPLALVRATAQFARYGRVVSGGSTIAMQVARLLEPHPHGFRGKLHDMARAVQLETHLSKAVILQLYLTLAPMGGSIEGVRTASLLYFSCEPVALTRSQAALLVSLPQSPARRRPDRYPEAAWRAASRVLVAAGDPPTVVATPIEQATLLLPGATPIAPIE